MEILAFRSIGKIFILIKEACEIFKYKLSEKFLPLMFLFFAFFIFLTFRLIDYKENQSIQNSVNSLLRNEFSSSNAYSLSKALIDLEYLGIIKCATLSEKTENSKYVYFDTGNILNCDGKKNIFEFQGINGIQYELKYQKKINITVIFFEATLYLCLFIILFLTVRKNRIEKKLSDEKIKSSKDALIAVELLAKQVAHDIRSPLSALNIITSTLSDVPEEKRLLIRNSVQRINDIANDLLQKGKSSSLSNSSSLSKSQDKNLDKKENSNLEFVKSANVSTEIVSQKQNSNFLVATVVDNIISEKRIQFREKINVNINVDLANSFGLFVNANPNELSRVISNLINNSVEALPNQSGNVDVSVYMAEGTDKRLDTDECAGKRLSTDVNTVCIQIKDNGSGIPKHILEKLGQSGVTHGKENSQSGSGLGVYHAMKTIQEFGGNIVFESITAQDIQNKNSEFSDTDLLHSKSLQKDSAQANSPNSQTKTGTTITIELPRSETPSWFADVIKLKPRQEFITVDDDISIHQIWKGRLQSLKSQDQNIKITSFTSAKEFREYFNTNLKCKFNEKMRNLNLNSDLDSCSENQIVFLIDYEFLNQNDNGFKIITDLQIQKFATLVTSRFDEPQIRQDCENQKIKILPKQLAGQIPILIHNQRLVQTSLNSHQIMDSKTTSIDFSPQVPVLNNHSTTDANSIKADKESTIENVSNNMKLSKYDLCLIDDDKLLIHSVWEMMAKEKGLNIKMFATPEEFLAESNAIDPHTPLYIDVSLANNVKGTDVAQDIHKLGFDNIYLATGYDADSIQVPSCVRQVVGKEFPL